MKKRRVLDVSDVDYVEIRVTPGNSQGVIQEERPEDVSPSLKGILRLTGKIMLYGVIGIVLLVKTLRN